MNGCNRIYHDSFTPKNRATILVVDDDKDIVQTIKGTLELDGYEVYSHGGGDRVQIPGRLNKIPPGKKSFKVLRLLMTGPIRPHTISGRSYY